MEAITLENFHKNPKYVKILILLINNRGGLTLNELMFFLSIEKIIKYRYKLIKKYGEKNRKDIFKNRQRLCDHLKRLKEIKIIKKDNKKYKIDLSTLFNWCEYQDAEIAYKERIKNANTKSEKIVDNIKNKYPEKIEELEIEIIPKTIRRRFPKLWEKLELQK
jgi:hypothetical protein